MFTGPAAAAMNGVDLSWIVGLVVVAPLYYFAARLFRKTPEAAPFQSPAFASDLMEAPRA
jgi:NCS1 family nucleobase:cation symporter-1